MNEELFGQLEKLKQRDIEARGKLLEEGRLYEAYEQEMQNIHVENAEALNDIVSSHGWPGISKVGLEGCRTAWLIAQHAICTPELQRRFLYLLKEAAAAGDAPMKQVALLVDRIRFNEGKPQVYGTVLDWSDDGELSCELENPERVDVLRDEVGLSPYQTSLREHRKVVEAEGGKPPRDFQAYKQAQKQWAKNVGWQ